MATPYVISSDLVSAYPAKSLEIAQYIDGFKADLALVQNAQTGTTYTFVAADFTKLVTASNAAASTYTIPPQSSVTWPANTLLRVTNLGAGVVTFAGGVGVTVTNTAATLAQYQTATLVRTGSDAWTVIRQGSNAPGMDLITPTSVAGSGVTVSGGQVTFTSATAITVNGVFTATYDNYLIVATGVMTQNSFLLMRMALAGVEASTNVYYRQRLTANSTTISGSAATSTSGAVASWDTSKSNLSLYVFNPALSEPTTWQGNSWAYPVGTIDLFSGLHDVSTAYDGVKFFMASGNTTGTLRIYGLRNS